MHKMRPRGLRGAASEKELADSSRRFPVRRRFSSRSAEGVVMRNPARSLRLPLVAVFLLLAPPASAGVTIRWVPIGNPGNPCDPQSQGCFGAVSYTYRISRYEVTNAQYAEFLNAKAASDPLGLYNTVMGSGASGGIVRSGVSGSYTYSVKTGFADKPVNNVSFYDALRFTNWLNNGQGNVDTETGAYTLLGGTATPSNWMTVMRNGGAEIFLPSEDEWYKAAYYSSGGLYSDYPTGTDTQTGCDAPTATANRANCTPAVGAVTTVGAYTGSSSPYGTFDQGGNVWEWNEQIVPSHSFRVIRGGGWSDVALGLAASTRGVVDPAGVEWSDFGFRVASAVPPVPIGGVAGPVAAGLLVLTGLLGIAYGQRRQGRASGRTVH
jgi:formylglycine-generating enzyme